MNFLNIFKLFLLAAIWGSSFIFMRVLSPVLGPILTTNLRVLIAGVVLTILFTYLKKIDLRWKENWKHYLIVGCINSALPFVLFSYAALHLPASYEVILNSTAPIFGAFFSWIWLQNQESEKMNLTKMTGLFLSTLGVVCVVNIGGRKTFDHSFFLSVTACLGAASCYALAGIYLKKFTGHVRPLNFAACSQLLAGIVLIPFSVSQGFPSEISVLIILNILGLSLLCSALAYVLYYQLIADVGPTKALTVTFLMPIFGMIWGYLILKEQISFAMIAGTFLILLGTWFVVKKK